jgi:hypothetical protein
MEIIRELEDGIVMRHATPKDADALSEFNGWIHGTPGEFWPALAQFTRDLLTRPHPTLAPRDFIVVEEKETGKIVSSLNYIPQTWRYDGIDVPIGRPELVGTDPAYRRRGLVRTQFEEIHRWGEERGHLMQVITGIPWYYRLFGYEMAIDLDGGRSCYTAEIPPLKEGESGPFRFRPATLAEAPFIEEVYTHAMKRWLVAPVRDAAIWRYELNGRSADSLCYLHTDIVELPNGAPVGFLFYHLDGKSGQVSLGYAELTPGASWFEAALPILRHLKEGGSQAPDTGSKGFTRIRLEQAAEHPLFEAVPHLFHRQHRMYAFYVRVPDIPVFLRHITPVLEERLARSIAVGYTGHFDLNLYTTGVRLTFDEGSMASVEPYEPSGEAPGEELRFPGLTFLQALFGHRSLDDLLDAYPDCGGSPRGEVLGRILFPPRTSQALPIS